MVLLSKLPGPEKVTFSLEVGPHPTSLSPGAIRGHEVWQ
jgi:hypothetical protein